MKMVKTLFLCNRKAPADLMGKILGTRIGSTTVFSTLLDKDNGVQIVFDTDVLAEEWYGCSDGTTTGYMKIKTSQIFHDFLTFTEHSMKIIHM